MRYLLSIFMLISMAYADNMLLQQSSIIPKTKISAQQSDAESELADMKKKYHKAIQQIQKQQEIIAELVKFVDSVQAQAEQHKPTFSIGPLQSISEKSNVNNNARSASRQEFEGYVSQKVIELRTYRQFRNTDVTQHNKAYESHSTKSSGQEPQKIFIGHNNLLQQIDHNYQIRIEFRKSLQIIEKAYKLMQTQHAQEKQNLQDLLITQRQEYNNSIKEITEKFNEEKQKLLDTHRQELLEREQELTQMARQGLLEKDEAIKDLEQKLEEEKLKNTFNTINQKNTLTLSEIEEKFKEQIKKEKASLESCKELLLDQEEDFKVKITQLTTKFNEEKLSLKTRIIQLTEELMVLQKNVSIVQNPINHLDCKTIHKLGKQIAETQANYFNELQIALNQKNQKLTKINKMVGILGKQYKEAKKVLIAAGIKDNGDFLKLIHATIKQQAEEKEHFAIQGYKYQKIVSNYNDLKEENKYLRKHVRKLSESSDIEQQQAFLGAFIEQQSNFMNDVVDKILGIQVLGSGRDNISTILHQFFDAVTQMQAQLTQYKTLCDHDQVDDIIQFTRESLKVNYTEEFNMYDMVQSYCNLITTHEKTLQENAEFVQHLNNGMVVIQNLQNENKAYKEEILQYKQQYQKKNNLFDMDFQTLLQPHNTSRHYSDKKSDTKSNMEKQSGNNMKALKENQDINIPTIFGGQIKRDPKQFTAIKHSPYNIKVREEKENWLYDSP